MEIGGVLDSIIAKYPTINSSSVENSYIDEVSTNSRKYKVRKDSFLLGSENDTSITNNTIPTKDNTSLVNIGSNNTDDYSIKPIMTTNNEYSVQPIMTTNNEYSVQPLGGKTNMYKSKGINMSSISTSPLNIGDRAITAPTTNVTIGIKGDISSSSYEYLNSVYSGAFNWGDSLGSFDYNGGKVTKYPIPKDIAYGELHPSLIDQGRSMGRAWKNTIGFGIDITENDNKKKASSILVGMGKGKQEVEAILSGKSKLSYDDMSELSTRYLSVHREKDFEPFLKRYGLDGISDESKNIMFNLKYNGYVVAKPSEKGMRKDIFNAFVKEAKTGTKVTYSKILDIINSSSFNETNKTQLRNRLKRSGVV